MTEPLEYHLYFIENSGDPGRCQGVGKSERSADFSIAFTVVGVLLNLKER
jgi:hypothetical protein